MLGCLALGYFAVHSVTAALQHSRLLLCKFCVFWTRVWSFMLPNCTQSVNNYTIVYTKTGRLSVEFPTRLTPANSPTAHSADLSRGMKRRHPRKLRQIKRRDHCWRSGDKTQVRWDFWTLQITARKHVRGSFIGHKARLQVHGCHYKERSWNQVDRHLGKRKQTQTICATCAKGRLANR
jgi:hypothetical protein